MVGYPVVSTKAELREFTKGKRKKFMVIFEGELVPIKCSLCEKTIEVGDGNRVWVLPRENKVVPLHYECAWNGLFEDLYRLGDELSA